MKNSIFLLVVLISFNSFSQESLEDRGDYFANYFFGNATIESIDEYKTTANVVGGAIGKEFILDKHFSIITSFEYSRIQNEIPKTDSTIQLFLTNNFIKIPVLVRFGFNIAEKSTVYAETGIYGASLIKSKVDNVALDSTQKDSFPGFNFGLALNIGFKYQMNSIYSFNLGINSQSDLFQVYNDSIPEYKINDVYTFQLGFGAKL